MKNIFLAFILFSSLVAVVHRVPLERETIQEGINAASIGDTVLVDEGIYYENLQINKEITVGSYFILDGNLSHRDSTIIDGSSANENSPYGSCVLFLPSDNGDPISAKLTGFTIQNGQGTRVNETIDTSEGSHVLTYRMGGGIMIDHCLPEITYNYIRNNRTETNDRPPRPGGGRGGGGGFNNDEGVEFDEDRDRDYPRTQLSRNDELKFSNNIFETNYSLTGNTFEAFSFDGDIDLSGSSFDVFASGYEDVSEYWVLTGEANNNFTGGSGELEAITYDIWVSPDGMDEKTNTGTEQDPFMTINYAFSRIYATSYAPITINLTDGTFSPTTTTEVFPIMMISNVNLTGEGEDLTILDADSTGRVIMMDNCENNIISHLTITGGNGTGGGISGEGSGGGGIHLNGSNPTLTHLTISGNTIEGMHAHGGGIYLNGSHTNMAYLTVSDNHASLGAGMCFVESDGYLSQSTISNNGTIDSYNNGIVSTGGIYFDNSNTILTDVLISMNEAGNSGGMHIRSSSPTLINVTIVDNIGTDNGGGMIIYYSHPIFRHVTIANNNSNGISEVSFLFSSLNISNSIIWNNSLNPIDFSISNPYNYIAGNSENENEYPFNADDYTLSDGSPCINTGNPDLWYQDQDGTPSDIGSTGGLFVHPNFISHDFGDVGPIGATAYFSLYNFRETTITIESVNFETSSFNSNTVFPFLIEPQQTGIININAGNINLDSVEDHMTLISNDLPSGINIDLSVQGTEQNVLSGDLSGTIHSGVYNISGHLNVATDDVLIIEPGTEFLFDGAFDFIIEGTLIAQGTEEDSILFTKSEDTSWRGFTLTQVSDETIFEYVRISGAAKHSWEQGAGMYLDNSDPIIRHVSIINNDGVVNGGGGMALIQSDPIMTYVMISDNVCDQCEGSGMHLNQSSPTMTYVTISNHGGIHGSGMTMVQSSPIMNNVTIVNNTAAGIGGAIYSWNAQPTLINCTISGNTAGSNNGGIVSDGGSSIEIINSIVWGNTPLSSTYATITYSDIEGGSDGEGNINTDPLFTDSENGDFTLQDNSPCIDTGIAIEGMEYVGSAPDMGAFEFGANYGCTDPEAINYDSEANMDDGSCDYSSGLSGTGCTNEVACNYDPEASDDDGSCEYIAEGDCDCDGNVLDCAGECNGTAELDCAGECDGTAELDCAGECDGTAELDCAGECDGIANIDECGDCVSSVDDPDWNLSCTGCTDTTAYNYEEDNIFEDGSCTYTAPQIDSIMDIANDQGGWVYIQFVSSVHDTDSLRSTENYTVERLDGENWIFLNSITAYGEDTYTTEARTLVDSTGSDGGLTTFRVIAGMDEGNWVGPSSDGYSVDNIPPSIPTGLLANVSGSTVNLVWDAPVDEDFNHFIIYRSENENFTPSDENLLGNSSEAMYTDTPPSGMEVVYYRVSAMDIHDNEGEASATVSAVLMSSMSIGYFTAWNMVGLPLSVEDSGYQSLFPNAQSGSLYSFDGIYQGQESLEPGVGYLLRMTVEDNVLFTGFSIDQLTINLSSGWNLFSGLSASISSDIVYGNDIVQSGTIYGLDGIYYSAETIDPGRGYWVRATEDGEITISSGVSVKQVSFVSKVEEANSIAFSNGNYTTELYFGVEIPKEEILSYSLPPTFPQMAFDVRFSGDMKYAVESGEIEILNQSETLTIDYDIKIDAGDKMEWVLSSETGDKFILEGRGEITGSSEQTFVLNRVPVIPETFTLHQNFPNPFNPVTTLSYDLPIDSDVRLAIFDMLGNEVTTMVNTNQQAGFKSVQWDATDSMGRPVSAGVYLYHIQAGEFVQTKKMVLLK